MTDTSTQPPVVDYETWATERRQLLTREKAHTKEGDAIAAARRRLPMTEVQSVALEGPDGATTLLDLFGDHDELIVYKHMFHTGQPIENQCPGCTLTIWHMHDASYLNARGIAYAIVSEGPWSEVRPFVDFMGYTVPWYSAHGASDLPFADGYGEFVVFLRDGDRVFLTNQITDRGCELTMIPLKLMDLTVYGRKEPWEDSPEGWPQQPEAYWFWATDGRPTPQWTRPETTPGNGKWPQEGSTHIMETAKLTSRDGLVEIEIQRRFAVSVPELWTRLTDPNEVAKWMAPVTGELQIGGRFSVVFDEDDVSQQVHGSILRCVAPCELAITWEIHEAGSSDVLATLLDHDDGCELRLLHTSLVASMGVGYAAGWHAYLDNLEALINGGPLPSFDDRWSELLPHYRALQERS